MFICPKCGAQLNDGSSFCTKCGTQIQDSNAIPTFTPPDNNAPVFTPPSQPARNFNGPVCYHHQDEPAVAQCARCGKYICKDCAEAYTVGAGEYANQCLCYDCCQALVAENVDILKKQKTKIITTFVVTIIGMIIGAALFSETGSAVGIIFGMLWIGSFWVWIKSSVSGWWNNSAGRSLAGFIGACIGGAIIAPINTIIKIVQCIKYLISTSKSIEEDSAALQQMTDYMEYTQVMSRNRGVDLETLMGQGSELYNNSYAQMVNTQGEAAADAMLRQGTTTIAENGEIIRNFAA
jgi:ribosomal protein L40E